VTVPDPPHPTDATAVAQARPASTVVVVDEQNGEVAVLMVRRNTALQFYGGFWVFPGGVIDAADGSDAMQAAAQAGCRELQEEAGLRVTPSDLVYWAHWITPSVLPRRYDTRFFIARQPLDQAPSVNDSEVTALSWLPLAVWTRVWEGGDFPVPFATQFVLRELAEALQQHGSLAAVLATAVARPVLTILPKALNDEVSVLPWDPHYEALPGHGWSWTPAQTATRGHWPSRG